LFGKRKIGYQSPWLKFRGVERFSSVVLAKPVFKIAGHAYIALVMLGRLSIR
jgi:hypothetical protein